MIFEYWIAAAALAVLLAALAVGWGWVKARRDGRAVHARWQREGRVPSGMSERDFADLYARCQGPRKQTYWLAAGATLFALTPLAFALMRWVWTRVWLSTGQYEPAAAGTMVYTFAQFLVFFALTLAVLGFALRRYHSLAPPGFNAAMRYVRGS